MRFNDMVGRSFVVSMALMVSLTLKGQGIRDSVFPIHPVEVTAGRIFMEERAGMKETVIDSSVLRGKINLSLSELLSENTSVFIKDHGRGALATASFRGTAASHTRVKWNGISINTPMAGMIDFSLIPVWIIDGLDLKHGASSLADQSGGIGGSIHIHNSAGWGQGAGFSYLQGIGSYGTFDEYLQLSAGREKIRIKTRLYHNRSMNDYPFINRSTASVDPSTGNLTHPLDTNDHADYARFGLLQEIYWRPLSGHILSLRYWGQNAERTIPHPTSYEGPDNDNLNSQEDIDHRVVGEWKYYRRGGRLMIRSGYTLKQLDYTRLNLVPGLGKVPVILSQSSQQSLLNTLSLSGETAGGFQMEGTLDVDFHDVVSYDSVSGSGYSGKRAETSLFFAIRRNFSERLNLNLMLRQDLVDRRAAPFTPYLGFDLRLRESGDLILKGNIARIHHYPDLNDLYWQPGGNPDLLPEEGFSIESGLEYTYFREGKKLSGEISLFRSDIDNWIIWLPSYRGYWEARNIRRVLAYGMETGLKFSGTIRRFDYRFTGGYALTRSVNYGDPVVWGDDSYGKQLVYIPVHSGNMLVDLRYRKWFITYQYNAYSERFTTSSNDPARRDRLYPYLMNDLVLGKEFHIGRVDLTTELKIFNLFNEHYHTVLYRPMPGRHYHLVVMLRI